MRKWWRRFTILPVILGLTSTFLLSQLFTDAALAAVSDVTSRPQVQEQAAFNTLVLCLGTDGSSRPWRASDNGVKTDLYDGIPSNNDDLIKSTDNGFVLGSSDISNFHFPVKYSSNASTSFSFQGEGNIRFGQERNSCSSQSLRAAFGVYNRTNPKVILCDLGYKRTTTGGEYTKLSCDTGTSNSSTFNTDRNRTEMFMCSDDGYAYAAPVNAHRKDNQRVSCKYQPQKFMQDNGIVGHDSLKNGTDAASYIRNYLQFYQQAGLCALDSNSRQTASDTQAASGYRDVKIWGFSSNNPVVEKWIISDNCYNQVAKNLEVDAGGNAPFLAFLDVVRPQLTAACRTSDPGSRQSILECAVRDSGGSMSPVEPSSGGGVEDEEPTCESQAGSMGWIMCPSLKGVTGAVNWIYGQIMGQFNYQSLNNNNSAIYDAWATVRNIANIAFIIVFLIIIYSTAVGVGLSNYSIKKIMPRLILVAIAVNLSFYICAALVDLSNIIGANLVNFLPGLSGSGAIDVGFAAGATLVIAIIIVAFVAAGTVLLSLLMVFVLMALRDVVLTALIIISPLAFVLYLLPNTERWAKKWLSEFSRMLFVYPMLALVWAVCLFMIGLIGSAAVSEPLDFMIKAVLLIIPAVTLLPIMKMGGQAMGALSNAVRKGADVTGASKAAKGIDSLGQRGGKALFNQSKRIPGIGKVTTLGERAKQWGKLNEEREKTRAAGRAAQFGSNRKLLDQQFANEEQELNQKEDLAKRYLDSKRSDYIKPNTKQLDWANKVALEASQRRVDRATSTYGVLGMDNNSDYMTALAMGRERAEEHARRTGNTQRLDDYNEAIKMLKSQGHDVTSEDALTAYSRAAMERSGIMSDVETTDILDAYAGANGVDASDTRATGLANLVNANRGKLGWLRSEQLGALSRGGGDFKGSAQTIADNLQKLNAGEVAAAKATQVGRIVAEAQSQGAAGIAAMQKLYNGIMADPTALSNMESGDAAAHWDTIKQMAGASSASATGNGGSSASGTPPTPTAQQAPPQTNTRPSAPLPDFGQGAQSTDSGVLHLPERPGKRERVESPTGSDGKPKW